MNPAVIELNEGHFRDIGAFVRTHFHEWLLEDRKVNGDASDIKLGRIENALQAELALSRDRFDWTQARFEALDRRFDEQMAFARERFALVDQRFALVDRRFEEMDERYKEQLVLTREEFRNSAGLEKERLHHLKTRMNRQFYVMITVTSAILAAVVGTVIQGFLA